MNIVLVSIHVENSPPAYPLAAQILKTAFDGQFPASELNTTLKEYYLPADTAGIAADLIGEKSPPDACGFSIYTWNAAEIIQICRELRRMSPGLRIFAGGPQVTAAVEDFKETGLFDILVRGEGETAIAEIIRTIDNAGKDSGRIIDTPPADFAGSVSPYKDLSGTASARSGILWEVSRGCPYNCAFCYESRGSRKIRTIPTDRIREELLRFKDAGIEKIWVLDPTFNHNRTHAQTVLESILEIHPEAHYTFEIRAELMTEKLCGLLSELDASLQIGLQSTNPAALENVNRKLSPGKFLEKCRMMSNYGLTFGIDLIFGLPGDDYRGFCSSLDFAAGCAPNNIDIFPLSILPGTELAEKAPELGINHNGFPTYQAADCRTFSRSDMQKAAALTEAVDKLYNREQSFAWFRTAVDTIGCTASTLFERFDGHRNDDPLDFIKTELRRQKKTRFLPIITSFIRWSRAAEEAFQAPGKTIRIRLSHKPEVLDQLTVCSPEDFIRRYRAGKEREYSIYFDGEELYIN